MDEITLTLLCFLLQNEIQLQNGVYFTLTLLYFEMKNRGINKRLNHYSMNEVSFGVENRIELEHLELKQIRTRDVLIHKC